MTSGSCAGSVGCNRFDRSTAIASVRNEVHDVTAPEGDRFDYPVVHLPRVAVALVVRDGESGEEVLMLRTYRYPVNR